MQQISQQETAASFALNFELILKDTTVNEFFLEGFTQAYKLRSQDFTRSRKLDAPELALFTAISQKRPVANALEGFWDQAGLNEKGDPMAQQAYSVARLKIKYNAFEDLFKATVGTAKKISPTRQTWHGYRPTAIDGSQINLPSEPYLIGLFGGNGSKGSNCAAQASVAYDVMNGFVLDARIGPIEKSPEPVPLRRAVSKLALLADSYVPLEHKGERDMAKLHIEAMQGALAEGEKALYIFDRGYPSEELIGWLMGRGETFLMRCKNGFNKEIAALPDIESANYTVNIGGYAIRAIKLKLPSGEWETLLTNITDKRMGIKAFKKLYFMRWPVEGSYNIIKNKLELENFTGKTATAIFQDYYATMYLFNVANAARLDAQEIADAQREGKGNKYEYNVNINHEIGVLKDHLVKAALEPDGEKREELVERILFRIARKVCPDIPDRQVPRKNPRNTRFHHNHKSNA